LYVDVSQSRSGAARTNLGLGTAALLNSGTSSGNVPVLDGLGKLEASILPDLAISEFYGDYADLAVALDVFSSVRNSQRGDWFTVSDDGTGNAATYIVTVDEPTTTGDITKIKTPTGGFTVAGTTNDGLITYNNASGQGIVETGLKYTGSLLTISGTGYFTSTGEPLRIAYNASNYMRFLVSSSGVVTYDATGNEHSFNNDVVGGIGQLNVDNLRMDGNILSATSGDLYLSGSTVRLSANMNANTYAIYGVSYVSFSDYIYGLTSVGSWRAGALTTETQVGGSSASGTNTSGSFFKEINGSERVIHGVQLQTGSDTGSVPVNQIISSILVSGNGTTLSTRPSLAGYNWTTKQWEVAANGNWADRDWETRILEII